MVGAGAIAASAHVRTERFVAMHEALARGDLAQGRAIYHELAPLLRALFLEPNPAPVKAALSVQGRIANELRAPMMPASDALTRELAKLLAA
jgi:4-hydroxy-tetrahydrodipicolinate synthase